MLSKGRNSLSVALVGCGYWGKNLLRVLSQLDGVEVRAVAEKSADAINHVRKHYPYIETSDEDRVLADPAIDALVIATPARDHYRAATLGLLADKHVFVEKPLAMAVAEVKELIALADDRGLTLMAGHTFLYNSAVRAVKALIDTGELGEVYYICSRRLNLGIVRQDVNALWNFGPHDVSIILYWMNGERATASAYGGTFLQDGIEDVVFLTMWFDSGTIANVHMSWLDPHKTRDMTVVGSKKMVVFDDVSQDAKVKIFDMGVDVEERLSKGVQTDSFGDFQLRHRSGDVTIPKLVYREPLLEQMEHFVHCVVSGDQPLTNGRQAMEVVRVLEEADRSLRERVPGKSPRQTG